MHNLFGIRRASPARGRTTKSYTRSSSASRNALSHTSSMTNNNYDSAWPSINMSSEEVDCFRSMRGTSITTANSAGSAMSADLTELDDRLDAIRNAGERVKKAFDRQGQVYHILVTHDEVRVCHIDEKGDYSYRHLPNFGSSSSINSRRNSAGATDKPTLEQLKHDAVFGGQRSAKPKKHPRRQIVHDSAGHMLVDILPDTVTVYHRDGVWRCHRFAGKIWDSDYATHVTAKMPRPWQHLRRSKQRTSSDANGDRNKVAAEKPELLLCSNTPGEGGPPPKAFKSFYHDL